MDANIVKTLEKALTDVNAPIGEHWGCGFLTTQNIKDTLDLLKQKNTEIDILIRKKETLKDELAEKQAEVERLKSFRKEGFINLLGNCLVFSKNLQDYNDMRKGLKSEARKEFAERSEKILIEKYKKYHLIANNTQLKEGVDMFYQGRAEAIWECIGVNRNLVKEMTEQM